VLRALTARGRRLFPELTRSVARAGRSGGRTGHDLGIVVEGKLIAWPAIDPAADPAGLDASSGLQLVTASPDEAKAIARRLRG
jgi:hypothetical protein